jgi:hypothetical protein
MNAALVLFFLATASAAGYGLVRLFPGGLTRTEALAWSFAAGQLIQEAIVLVILAFRLLPGPRKILAAEVLVVAGSFAWRRVGSGRAPARASEGMRWAPAILLGVALAGILLFAAVALSAPMDATDFLAIWGMKGKTIFATSSIPARLFHDRALEWSHPEYPLGIPLWFSALASALRAWDDRALALLYPACQAATVLVLWGFLSRRTSREAAGVAAALAAFCLPLYSRGNVGTGEIPIALGFLLAATAACDVREQERRDAVWRFALASLFCAAVKQEGAFFVLLLAGSLLFLERRRAWSPVVAALIPVLAHGALLRILRGPVNRRDYDLTLLEPDRWGELLSRATIVARRIVSVEVAHAALVLSAIVAFVLVTRRGLADWLAVPIAIQVLVYASVCALCAFGPLWLVQTSFSRITLALVPVLVLVLAARLDGSIFTRVHPDR